MRKGIAGFALLFVFFILQSTIASHISINNIAPNLILILVASFGFMFGEQEGMVIGFFGGLLLDVFFGTVIGVYALFYLFIGYLNGKFCRLFYPEEFLLPGTLIMMSDFLLGLMNYVFLFLLRGRIAFPFYLLHIIVPEVIYTLVVSIAFYPLLLWIAKRIEKKNNRSKRKFV